MKLLTLVISFAATADAFQSMMPSPSAHRTATVAEVFRRDAFASLGLGLATLGAAATPALALRSVLSEEEEAMLRRKESADAARARNEAAYEALANPKPVAREAKKLKWQEKGAVEE